MGNMRFLLYISKTGVRIRFLGEAKVHWEEQESYRNHEGKRRSRTVDYRGNEEYVNNTTRVHGEGVLQPGTYNWNFNIALPASCPTSCEGKYGKIRYELRLTIDRPFRFDNEFHKPLTILRMVDLNMNPAYRVSQVGIYIHTITLTFVCQ